MPQAAGWFTKHVGIPLTILQQPLLQLAAVQPPLGSTQEPVPVSQTLAAQLAQLAPRAPHFMFVSLASLIHVAPSQQPSQLPQPVPRSWMTVSGPSVSSEPQPVQGP